eukprot:gene14443-20451_t
MYAGAAVKGNHLITVGDSASIFIWTVDVPPPSAPPSYIPTSLSSPPAPTQTTRQWLPVGPTTSMAPPTGGATHPSAKILSATGLRMLPGFPLNWEGGDRPHSAPSGSAMASPRAQGGTQTAQSSGTGVGTLENPAIPRPLGLYPQSLVSSIIGFTPCGKEGHNMVWRPDAALFAYAVDNVLIQEDLATRKQRKYRSKRNCPLCGKEGQNMAWHIDAALFVYAVDNVLVQEDLATRRQRHHTHHTQPVASVAVSSAAHLMASAAWTPEPTSKCADICLWDTATGALRSRLCYHPQGVQTLAFSPNDAYLLSVGRDPERSLVVWDLATEEVVAVGRTQGRTLSVAWLPESSSNLQPRFVSGGTDGLYLWTLQATCLEQLPIFVGEMGQEGEQEGSAACVTAVAVDSDGTVVVASESGYLHSMKLPEEDPGTASITRVADTRLGHPGGVWSRRSELSVDGSVASLWLDPMMREAVCGTTSATMWFLGLPDEARVPLLCGHQGPISALAASWGQPDMMVSASLDGVVRVWQMGGGQPEPLEEFQTRTSPPAACTAAAINPSDGTLLAGYSNGGLRLISIRDVSVLWTIERHTVTIPGGGGSPVVSVQLHPRRTLAISAAKNGSIAVTNLSTSELAVFVDEFVAPISKVPSTASPDAPPLDCLAVSYGGASMCAAAWSTHFVVFACPWEESLMRDVAIYRCEESAGSLSTDVPSAISFVPGDAKAVVYTSPLLLGKILLFDYRLARVSRSIVLTQMSRSLAVSPDGHFLAVGGMGGSSYVIDYENGKWVELSGHIHPVSALQFSGDSCRLVSAAGTSMVQWAGLYEYFLPTKTDFLKSRLL